MCCGYVGTHDEEILEVEIADSDMVSYRNSNIDGSKAGQFTFHTPAAGMRKYEEQETFNGYRG